MADLRRRIERLRAAAPSMSVYARRRTVAAIVLIVLAAGGGVLLGGGSDGPKRPVPQAGGGGPGGGSTEATSFLARMVPPAADSSRNRRPGVSRSLTDLARRLPLERKVAQLFLLGFRGRDVNAPVYRQLRRLDLGGILIDRANYANPQQLSSLAGKAGAVARRARHVRPWVMARQEGGEFNAFPNLPPQSAPGNLDSVAQARGQAREAGRRLRSLGVNGMLGPVADVGLSEQGDDALGARVFSDEPSQVAAYAEAAVLEYGRANLFTAVEHFPGLGSATVPTEEGPANVGQSLGELRARDLVPFRAAFRAGAPGVVLSSGMYAADDFVTPGSVSPKVATGLLRRDERFRGVAVTDDLADPAVSVNYSVPDAAVAAVRAGADLLYISGSAGDQQAAYAAVLGAARRGRILPARLDEALLRNLTAKRGFGLIR